MNPVPAQLALNQQINEQQLKSIIYAHSKSFFFASSFLSSSQRQAIWALYAFCRATDDLVDLQHQQDDPAKLMDEWKNDLLRPQSNSSIIRQFQAVIEQYQIPLQYALELIDGCKRDLTQKSYSTFSELSQYCYQVAATVGLMSVHIIGFDPRYESEMKDKAIKAGVALQLTNIIRDVGEDLDRGRLYLPLEDFAIIGCDPQKPDRWKEQPQFKNLIALQIDRARSLYEEGRRGLKYLEPHGRFAITAALGVYERILNKVEENDYDVLNKRAVVPLSEKILLLPLILWQSLK